MNTKCLIITTFNREENLKVLLQSVDISKFNEIIIVQDGGGNQYSDKTLEVLNNTFTFLQFQENVGVGICKQTAINKALLDEKNEHIFLVEDDIAVKNNEVWDYYIEFSKKFGIYHTNWNDYRYKSVKFEVKVDEFTGIVTRDTEGSFSYFHRNLFKFCEFPPDMKNAFEHISVELQLIENYLLPPFWNFICPKGTDEYLKHLDCESTITDKENYSENYKASNSAFIRRHKTQVSDIPDSPQEKVLERIKFLKDTYSR